MMRLNPDISNELLRIANEKASQELPKIWVDVEDLQTMVCERTSIKTRIFDHEERGAVPYMAAQQAPSVPPLDGPIGLELSLLVTLLAPLARIAQAYEESALDEVRPDPVADSSQLYQDYPRAAELYSGRGGKCLLTLDDCLRAREFLKGAAWGCGVHWNSKTGLPMGYK